MKLTTKTLIASALFAMATAPASAIVSKDLKADVLSALGSGSNVRVHVVGDTVTLSGYAEDSYSVAAAGRAALATEGVERVVNNVFKTN